MAARPGSCTTTRQMLGGGACDMTRHARIPLIPADDSSDLDCYSCPWLHGFQPTMSRTRASIFRLSSCRLNGLNCAHRDQTALSEVWPSAMPPLLSSALATCHRGIGLAAMDLSIFDMSKQGEARIRR